MTRLSRIRVEAWNGLDAVARIVNTARRAKLVYHRINAAISDKLVYVTIEAEGSRAEAKWLAAKLERLPEVYRVELEPVEEAELEKKMVA